MQLSNVYINCTNLYIMQLKPQFTNTLWRVLWGVYLRRQDLTVAIHSQRPLDVLRGRVSQQLEQILGNGGQIRGRQHISNTTDVTRHGSTRENINYSRVNKLFSCNFIWK